MKFAIKLPTCFLCAFEKAFKNNWIWFFDLWCLFNAPPLLATLRQIYYTFFCNIRGKRMCRREKHFQTERRFRSHTEIMRITEKNEEKELLGHKNGNVINHLTQISAIWLVYVTHRIACLQIDHNYCWLFTTASVNWTLSGDVWLGSVVGNLRIWKRFL